MITPPSQTPPPADPAALAEPDGAGGMTAVEAAELGLAPAQKSRSLLRRGWEVFAENKLALAGIAVVVFMVLFSFVVPIFYATNQVNTNLTQTLCTPGGAHLLGCDNLGYDQLGRLMVGGQTSLEVGLAAAAVLFGTLYGAVSGFVGGPVDAVMMRIVDAG